MMIAANAQLADWQTAGHWSEAATNWCARQAINGFPGICRVHRAEIMRLRGAFSEAEEEARTATVELASFNLMFTALAFRELGEVRLKMGELESAEEAFRQASEMGVIPEPGMALLLAQRGKLNAAATQLRRALAHTGLGPLERAKLLPAQLDIALAMGELDVARAAAEELGSIAEVHTKPAVRATAAVAAAAVAFADGMYDEAFRSAQDARKLFSEIDLCYESARAALLVGQVYAARGETDQARSELSGALTTLQGIGAVPDARRAEELIGALPS
jgi:ATP/maltotriose-dependent transcriptional regulator MalT